MLITSLRLFTMIFSLTAYPFIATGCMDTASTTPSSDDDFEDDDEDDDSGSKLTDSDKDDDKKESSSSKKADEKVDTTVVRRQLTNVSDKITRAQANLQRTETLRNSARQRLEDTKAELAKVNLEGNGGVSIGTGGGGNGPSSGQVKRTKAELEKLVKDQTLEVDKFDTEVKAIEDEIAALEAEIDALTLKLEKKPAK